MKVRKSIAHDLYMSRILPYWWRRDQERFYSRVGRPGSTLWTRDLAFSGPWDSLPPNPLLATQVHFPDPADHQIDDTVTKEDIQAHFKEGTGNITEVKLMNGFGFIEYDDPMDARDVVPGMLLLHSFIYRCGLR